ncbi:unnamed protein product [Lactuca saligna]|uniref:DUF4283 domain-containing protein n=1 Tax=Lactuca saligna TaxID=75948 RepID=A0AA35VN39_LACSI|nr:unnamed protein product [Lactuca saligna]
MEGEWTEAERRRWKRLLRIDDHPRWKHEVDVYMATKKNVNIKYFAFVRLKKVDEEYGLEKALQGIKCDGRFLEVNLSMYERKPIGGPANQENVVCRIQSRFPQVSISHIRDNKSYAGVTAGILHNFDHLEKVPYSFKNCDGSGCEIKYMGGLRIGVKFKDLVSRNAFMMGWMEWFKNIDSGDIATINFERFTWIKIMGLPPELWYEENFTSITKSYGQVVVPFAVDQAVVNLFFGKIGILTFTISRISCKYLVEASVKINKIGILEVDIDWALFKARRYSQDEISSSEETCM